MVVDHLDAEPGAEVTFDKVLLVEDGDGAIVAGTPFVNGASVTGVVVEQAKGKKIVVFKMKRRKGYRRTQGHRTLLTRVRVQSINSRHQVRIMATKKGTRQFTQRARQQFAAPRRQEPRRQHGTGGSILVRQRGRRFLPA